MALDAGSIFIYVIGLFILYVCCWIFIKPLKWILKFLFRWFVGGGVVWLINYIFSGVGIHIAVNLLNAMTIGVLGIPGAVMLIILEKIL